MKSKPRRPRIPTRLTRQLEKSLSTLEQDELIRPQLADERIYSFKHALTQDAAESTLLHGEFRRLNHLVAQAYETVYAERCMDEFAPVLAQHYRDAGDAAEMFNYALRAGEQAMQVQALDEALTYYALAAGVSRTEGTSAQVQQLFTRRGRAYELQDEYDLALDNYREMEAVGQARGDRTLELWSIVLSATLFVIPTPLFDIARGRELSDRALALARAWGDRPAESKILWNLMLVEVNARQPAQAIEYGEASRTLARELGLTEQLAFTNNDLGRVYGTSGQLERALERLEEARSLWRQLGNQWMLADSLMMSSNIALLTGNFDQALALTREGREIGAAVGSNQGIFGNAGTMLSVLAAQGEYAASLDIVNYMLDNVPRYLQHPGLLLARALGAWLYAHVGALERAREMARGVLSELNNPMPPLFRIWASANTAQALMACGDRAGIAEILASGRRDDVLGFEPGDILIQLAQAELAVAQKAYTRAAEAMRELVAAMVAAQVRFGLPDAYYFQAIAVRELGDTDMAWKLLSAARELAGEMQARPILWLILAAMADCELQGGNTAAADELKRQARGVIAELGERTPPEYRGSFLALPQVREVMA